MGRKKSYEQINYRLRPAKSIERKLLCEAFRRLSGFERLDLYRYVGMGSAYFRDFVLIHRALGISDMVSIEREKAASARFEFNRPFNCIKMEYGETTSVLPKLDWGKRSIVWLDYDGRLDTDVLADVALVCGQAPSGSILVVSVNAHASDEPGKMLADALADLKYEFGAKGFPPEVTVKDLSGWGTAALFRRLISSAIREAVAERNGLLPEQQHLSYTQLFNFQYQDDSKMCTVGGVITSAADAQLLARCDFPSAPGTSLDDTPVRIEVPNLTLRELQRLDVLLPVGQGQALPQFDAVKERDVRAYADFYRYFPLFSEVET